MSAFSLRLPDHLEQQLHEEARLTGQPRSQLMREALESIQIDIGSAATAPGPLPLLGAGAAFGRSRRQLVHWLGRGPVVINAIIYGELGLACERIESLDALLPAHLDDYRAIPRVAAFLAARAHAAYCERGGTRPMILPDFQIRAHALVENLALLTRDGRRYRQAFPGWKLITPQA